MKRIVFILLLAGISWVLALQPEALPVDRAFLDSQPDSVWVKAAAVEPGYIDTTTGGADQANDAFRLVAQVGAPPLFMVMDGAFAYISTGNRFAVIDYSIDWNPQVAYTSGLLPGYVFDIAIIQGYAYLAVSPGGIKVWDVHDPYHPFPVGEYGANAVSLEDAGAGRLYVSDGSAMTLWDIHDPAQLVPIGSFAIKADHFIIDGDQLYAEEFYCTEGYFYKCEIYLGIYTLIDPLQVSFSSITLLPVYYPQKYQRTNMRSIQRQGDRLFIFGGRLEEYDIQDPGSPVYIDQNYLIHYAQFMAGARVYILSRVQDNLHQGRLEVIDYQDPQNPVSLGSYPLVFAPEWIYSDGWRAWIIDNGNRVLLLDVSDPTDIRMVSTILIDQYKAGGRMAYTNNSLVLNFLVFSLPRGFQVVDTSNHAQPVLAQEISTPWWVTGVASKDDILIASEESSDPMNRGYLLQLFNTSSSGQYDLLSSMMFTDVSSNASMIGDYAFIYNYIIDYSDPRHPTRQQAALPNIYYESASDLDNGWSVFPQFPEAWQLENSILTQDPENACVNRYTSGYAVAISGTLAVVAGSDYLSLFDISQPMLPVQLSRTDLPETGLPEIESPDIDLEGNRVYLEDRLFRHLKVFNISDPISPTMLGALTMDYASDLDVQGNLAYFSGVYTDCLRIYQEDFPNGIQLLGSFQQADPEAYCSNVLVDGGYAYLVQSGSIPEKYGLRILDISDPSSPVNVGFFPPAEIPPGFAEYRTNSAIGKSGNWLFYSLDGAWIFVDDISDPTAPQPISQFYAGPLSEIKMGGQRLFVKNEKRIGVWDLEDIYHPHYEGSLFSPWSSENVPWESSHIATDGTFLYVPCSDGLKALDPNEPLPMGLISVPGREVFHFVAVDEVLYAIGSALPYSSIPLSCKLLVFDNQNPLQPVLVNQDIVLKDICYFNGSRLLRVGEHSLVYLDGDGNRMVGIDISDGLHPIVQDTYVRPYGFFRNGVAEGSYLFTLTESGAIEVYHYLFEDGQRFYLPLVKR